MADKKISELTSITGTSVSDTNDTIAIVDSSAGQTKKITREELFNSVDGANFTGDVLIQETFDVALTLRSNSSTDARIKFIRPAGSSYEFANEAGEFRLKRGTSGATDTFNTLTVSSGSKWRFYDPNDGTELARMQPVYSGLPSDTTVVTRVTGDARYTQISSDERLKENILEMEDVGGLIDSLRPVRFNWKENENDPKPEGLMYGMIAQEVSQVAPEISVGSLDSTMGIDSLSMISVLVKEVQELRKRVAEIENI